MNRIYDPIIRRKIKGNYDGKAVLNKMFEDWDEFISYIIPNKGDEDGFRHIKVSEAKLLNQLKNDCIAHENNYANEINNNMVLSLTHPLYLFFNDERSRFKNEKLNRQALRYFNNLITLLNNVPRDKVSVVMFETPDHYAAATSLWHEQGLVDRVYFTGYDTGEMTNVDILDELNNKKVVITGGYNEECLDGTLENTVRAGNSIQNIWAIKPLVIDTPLSWKPYKTIHDCGSIGFGSTTRQ
ncbi:MAG: hypothetical protein ABH828_06535 [archaeon]